MSRVRNARLVGEWAEQLRADLAGPGSEQAKVTQASKLDVLRRGLDPKEDRKFCGRIAVTIRCHPSKHLLGYVYPTAFLPVFVPSVSAVREGLLDNKTRRAVQWPADASPDSGRHSSKTQTSFAVTARPGTPG